MYYVNVLLYFGNGQLSQHRPQAREALKKWKVLKNQQKQMYYHLDVISILENEQSSQHRPETARSCCETLTVLS